MKASFLALAVLTGGIALLLPTAASAVFPIQQLPPRREPPKFFTNSIGMKFAWIRAGSFQMGPGKNETRGVYDHMPHRVTLSKGFYMGVHLVTQEQWQKVMGANPSHFKLQPDLPVDSVSWDDCQEFATKLTALDRKPYRLPTEAQWEYACRAGTKTPFHFGENISTDQANYDGNQPFGNGPIGISRGRTTPVDAFPANAWGLHDMHGNLYQWCQDYWQETSEQKDEADPQGPEIGTNRVLRSAPFQSSAACCRSSCRVPGVQNCHVFTVGFRVGFFVN